MLKQNKFLLIILFSLILLINCSDKNKEKCNPNRPLSFINIYSEKTIGSIKVYQYKNNVLKDSMSFIAVKKNNADYAFSKDGSDYSIELKKTYTFTDKFKVLIDQKEYILKDFKVSPSKVGTNYQKENLCEVQEYSVNGKVMKSNSVLISLGKD
ncbi:hypothetical protein [Chryseobacterium arachidis]|nr:hypothetical protein [Chryseobacterium arachidis]